MTQQLANREEALAAGDQERGEGMPQVIKAGAKLILNSRCVNNLGPRLLYLADGTGRGRSAGKDMVTVPTVLLDVLEERYGILGKGNMVKPFLFSG